MVQMCVLGFVELEPAVSLKRRHYHLQPRAVDSV